MLDKLFSKERKRKIKYKLSTDIGRFYFYFEKEDNSNMSGKLVFFPDKTNHGENIVVK